MEVASHGHCYSKVSLSNPFHSTPIHKRHALGKKRVPLKRRVLHHHTVRIHSQAGFGRGTVKIKEEEEELETQESEPSRGTKKLFKLPVPSKLPGTVKLQNKSQSQTKSNKVVFVAGATGKVGSRTVRELLKLGFNVRASTRNVEKAQTLFEGVDQSSSNDAAGSDDGAPFGMFSPAKLFGFLKPKVSGKKLEIVECDLENPESIETALGNAGVVVCCIGASEKEVLDVTGPYRIDFKATENLIKAASSADVSHFVLLTSLGTQKFGFPAAVLNLFWGVLVWKAKAEKALIQSGIPYTIVRPGGMERPTDAYKETHNLILAEPDKLFGGQVSNLQVAELLASIVENPDVSVNKIVEAIAETSAPLRPIRELLEGLPAREVSTPAPQSIRKARPGKADVFGQKASKKQEEERLAEEKRGQAERAKEQKRIQAESEKKQKRIQAEQDEKDKLRLQALRKKYEEEFEAARDKEEAAKSAAAAALAEKAELEKKAAEIRAKVEAAALAASQAKAVEAAVLAAARKGEVLSDEEKQKIMESVRLARLPKEAAPAEKPKPGSKKKPLFSFAGRAAPSSTTTKTAAETEPSVEEESEKVKVEADSKVRPKADKKAVAEKKQKEDTRRKEEDSKKLAEAKKKEEQERLQKEATEQAEKEASEAKQKKEVEAKKKEEEELAKKRAEAEAKKKEEENAKKAAEAEARRKEEEKAGAKKREEEEKAKEEEMLKAEAEEKAKALAEQEAAKQFANATATEDEAQEEVKKTQAPRRKGFRWFWQPAEPDEEVADVQESTKDKVPDVPMQGEVANQLPPCPTPLSPYTSYPGLKPPSPPTASPSAPKTESPTAPKAEKVAGVMSPEIKSKEQTTAKVEVPPQEELAPVSEEPSKDPQDDTELRKRRIEETKTREREALEKAQAAIPFKWFWQNSESTEEESAPTFKEEEPAPAVEAATTVPEEEPAPAVEAATTVSEKAVAPPTTRSPEKTNSLPSSSGPLSPYAQFPNLKPPSPPKAFSARPNGSLTPEKLSETLPRSSTPLSPYTGFPDLKPPSSPAPLAENGAVPAAAAEEAEENPAEPTVGSGLKWPWQQ